MKGQFNLSIYFDYYYAKFFSKLFIQPYVATHVCFLATWSKKKFQTSSNPQTSLSIFYYPIPLVCLFISLFLQKLCLTNSNPCRRKVTMIVAEA
jgi:hypothetical protein